MVRKTAIVSLCLVFLTMTSLSLAGGPTAMPAPCAPISYPPKAPCGPGAGPGGPQFWGDAPIPGLCGGIIALPFLVVGSLLGGNSMGPVPAAPPVAYGQYNCAPIAPACAPAPCPPPIQKTYIPPCGPVPAGPAPCGPGTGGGLFSGLPCFELCAGLLGGIGIGTSLY